MEKVVKCNKCGKYFGHSEKATKCPFCKTEYSAVVAEQTKETRKKNENTKTQKNSFKIWKDN